MEIRTFDLAPIPLYNGDVPRVLKNAIDRTSRASDLQVDSRGPEAWQYGDCGCKAEGQKMKGHKVLGAVLLAMGIVALAYRGFGYTKQAREAKLGPIAIQVKERERVEIPAWVAWPPRSWAASCWPSVESGNAIPGREPVLAGVGKVAEEQRGA